MIKKKIELLAPAGSFEAMKAAIANGCNAVYLAGDRFGARAYAKNFDEDTLKVAVAYAHVYGVQVFVTMNTLLYDDEMIDALAYAKRLQAMDVDALIIQDMGLLHCLRQTLPDMELHASTQMHIHNPQGIQYLKRCGAKRVVLPRETTIEEISTYTKAGLDVEVFVQGALCIAYSGQCLMSACTQDRSGNRGECAQSCRMQYTLEKAENKQFTTIPSNGKYLLSPKDLYTIEHIPQLIEAGVTSFKIEGRMKRSEYVALMCACYRKAIDAYVHGKTFRVSKQMREDMEKIFNRGFTSGHIFHQQGTKLMHYIRPNHIGIVIGEVVDVRGKRMQVKLSKSLAQGDGIRIINDREDVGFRANKIYKNGLLVNHADAFDMIEFDRSGYVQKGDRVLKTTDCVQLAHIQETFRNDPNNIPIQGYFTMQKGEVAVLQIEDGIHHVVCVSQMSVEEAKQHALKQARIDAQLQKTKSTPFYFTHITYEVDNDATMPIKEINQMRRNALEELRKKREIVYENRRVHAYQPPIIASQKRKEVLCAVQSEEQFMACYAAGISHIFVDDEVVYQKLLAQGYPVLQHTPRIMKGTYANATALVEEYGAMDMLTKRQSCFAGTSMNVTNVYTALSLLSQGIQGVTLSYEVTIEQAIQMAQHVYQMTGSYGNIIMPIYGRIELMISQYCPINAVILDNQKKHCQLCRGKATYYLKDLKGHRYVMRNNRACQMRLYDEKPRNLCDQIPLLKNHHIHSFLCVFTDEDAQEVEMLLEEIKRYGA